MDTYRIALSTGKTVSVRSHYSPATSIEHDTPYVGELVDNGKVVAYHLYVNPRHIVTAVKA